MELWRFLPWGGELWVSSVGCRAVGFFRGVESCGFLPWGVELWRFLPWGVELWVSSVGCRAVAVSSVGCRAVGFFHGV